MSTTPNNILPGVGRTIARLTAEFNFILPDRRKIIGELTDFISRNEEAGHPALLNFICTHNSRRSHISQIWAGTAAHYYGIRNVETFSGGTEATAFNPRAASAMRKAGFGVSIRQEGTNPVYEVRYAEGTPPLTIFSKKYDHESNPRRGFAAIMTCSHADANCPIIPGAATRIALTYNDPKDFDGTPSEAAKYAERVHEIGREILFAFSTLKKN
jgi:arsenate reductase